MTAEQLIKVALAEVGYKEKASNSQLDDPTANAGSKNWTKYARDLAAAGYYNGNKNGYAWCDVFVDWCFYQAAGKNRSEAERIECQTGDCGAGCTYSKQYYEKQGRCDMNPKVGDQIFFRWSGNSGADHTGIVTKVTSGMVYTVEGNSGEMVKEKSYSRSSGYIIGYGHPKYEASSTVEPEPSIVVDNTLAVGDIVQFTGNKHYTSAMGSSGKACKPGEAEITQIYRLGDSKHPYHLIATKGSASTVYGWVDTDTIAKTATPVAVTEPAIQTPLQGDTTAEKIWKYLMSKINNAFGVAGLMGNLYAESAYKPSNLQNSYEKSLGFTDETYTQAVDDGSYTNFVKDAAGYGLAQWTYWSRKESLLNFAKDTKRSIGDLEMQLEFLISELAEYGLFSTLQKAKSIREVSDIILLQFERPADTSDAVKVKRASYGQDAYDKFADTTVAPPANLPNEPIDTTLPVLKRGAKSTAVKSLQVLINFWNNVEIEVDGSFGPLTEEQVILLQRRIGIKDDGVVGAETWAVLIGK